LPKQEEDKYGKKKDKKNVQKRKKYYKKEKNDQAYFVEWDSDASSDEDDDDKSLKGLAGVAIKEAPSLFSKPYCLMAKSESKVIIEDDMMMIVIVIMMIMLYLMMILLPWSLSPMTRNGSGSGMCGYDVYPPQSVPAPSAYACPPACPRAKIYARARARRISTGTGNLWRAGGHRCAWRRQRLR
jgi:hypothetical protein